VSFMMIEMFAFDRENTPAGFVPCQNVYIPVVSVKTTPQEFRNFGFEFRLPAKLLYAIMYHLREG